jgi:hypothetical protein
VILGTVTVKLPEAVLLLTSVALTVVPDVPLGTLNVQLNLPVVLAVNEPLVQLVIVLESKTSDFSFVDAVKPAPETVTFAPWGPCVGLTLMDGVRAGPASVRSFELSPATETTPFPWSDEAARGPPPLPAMRLPGTNVLPDET